VRINDEQARAAYAIAVRVYAGELTIQAGTEELKREHRLNSSSARDFINDFKCMMTGRVFHRTMNAYATDYFLTHIRAEFGVDALYLALKAVSAHVSYYEDLRKTKLGSLRKILKAHTAAAGTALSLVYYQNDLEKRIVTALADSSENRRKRLKTAPKVPKTIVVTAKVFVRNPDVVAEVLVRANGICERCKNPAPFLRAKDGLPYLEVHHKIQLARGGDDTVDNAWGLCPNCHREVHHGKQGPNP
jgi:5-methylcytosine-specific restriction enzyme A